MVHNKSEYIGFVNKNVRFNLNYLILSSSFVPNLDYYFFIFFVTMDFEQFQIIFQKIQRKPAVRITKRRLS